MFGLVLCGIVLAVAHGSTQDSAYGFPHVRTAYVLTLERDGVDVIDRVTASHRVVPFGQRMTFAGSAKFSKPSASMVRNVGSHLEAYTPWDQLVDLPVDFLRTGVSWPSGADWGQLASNPPRAPDRADKIIVGYINAVEFTAIGKWDPSFRPSWDRNGDAIIDSDVTGLPDYVDTRVFNADWKAYVAAYWTESWKQELARKIDYAAAQHLDGIMLDVMTGYETWNAAYPTIGRDRLQERMADLFRWISAYAKSRYGSAFLVTANLDPNARQYFPDLGAVVDGGYYQNGFFEWNGSGVVNGYLRSTTPDGYENPIVTYMREQGLPVLGMDHLGTGPMTPGLDFPNYDDRINGANLQKLFRWAIESGATPYCAPVFFGTPFTVIPRFVRLIAGAPTRAASPYADWVIGTDAADSISTGTGDDMVYGGRGDDVIDGGPGINTAFYLGVHTNFRVTLSDGRIAVEDVVKNEGRDTFINVQYVQFADGPAALDSFSPSR